MFNIPSSSTQQWVIQIVFQEHHSYPNIAWYKINLLQIIVILSAGRWRVSETCSIVDFLAVAVSPLYGIYQEWETLAHPNNHTTSQKGLPLPGNPHWVIQWASSILTPLAILWSLQPSKSPSKTCCISSGCSSSPIARAGIPIVLKSQPDDPSKILMVKLPSANLRHEHLRWRHHQRLVN